MIKRGLLSFLIIITTQLFIPGGLSAQRQFFRFQISDSLISYSGNQTMAAAGSSMNSTTRLFAPRMLYDRGKTYLVYMSRITRLPNGQVRVLAFDKDAGFDRPYIAGNVLRGHDNHAVPSLAVDDSTIYIVQENQHNTPLQIYKSTNGDHGRFVKQKESIGKDLAYAHPLRKDDGDFVIWSRGVNRGWDIYVTQSSRGFGGWGPQRKITENPENSVYKRHYPSIPFGHGPTSINGKFYLLISVRIDGSIEENFARYYRYYLLVTRDFDSYSNYHGTWTHSIEKDGLLTDQLLLKHFGYFSTNERVQAYVPCTGISNDGLFRAITGNEDGTGYLYHYADENGWQSRPVNIPNLRKIENTDAQQSPPFDYLMVYNQNEIYVVADIEDGSLNKPHIFRTTDDGITWEDGGDLIPEITGRKVRALLPNNMLTIPDSTNFPFYFTSIDNNTPETVTIFAKYGASRQIQPLKPLQVKKPNEISQPLFHFTSAEFGQKQDTLTDRYGITKTVTVLSDSVANLELLNDSLKTMGAGTFVFVGRSEPGKNATALVFFDRNSKFQLKFKFNAANRKNRPEYLINDPRGTNETSVFGQRSIDDNKLHVLTFVVDGRSKVDIYIDGQLQYFETNAKNEIMYTMIGSTPSRARKITNIRLGSGRGSNERPGTLTLEEVIAWDKCLPLQELYSLTRSLCERYGIEYRGL